MESENPQPWKITVRAKTKRFRLNFELNNAYPILNFLKLSFFLKAHQSLLEVKSGPAAKTKRPRTLKSRFVGFFNRFRNTSPSKKRTIASKKTAKLQRPEKKYSSVETSELQYPERNSSVVGRERLALLESIHFGGSLLVGVLASLSHSIWKEYQKGIIICGLLSLLFIVTIMLKSISRKKTSDLWILLLGIAVGFYFAKYMNYDLSCVSELVWKAWNYCLSPCS